MQTDIRKRIMELKSKEPNVKNRLHIAKLYLSAKNYHEAIYVLMDIIKNHKSAEANLLLGDLYFDQQDFLKANQYYSETLKLMPSSFDAYLGLTKTHLLLKNYVSARDYLEFAKNINDADSRVLLMDLLINFELYSLQKVEQSLKNINMSGLDAKIKPIVEFIEGMLFFYRKQHSKALSIFEALKTKKNFDNPESKNHIILENNIGLCNLRSKNIEVAKKIYSELVSKVEKLKEPCLGKRDLARIYLNYSIALWLDADYVSSLLYLEKANNSSSEIYPYYRMVKEYVQSKGESLKKKVQSLRKDSIKRGLNYGLYLGCVIPNRYPMDELATRVVLDYLDVGIRDLEGASCCPAPGVFRSFDIPTWLSLGARNISLSEQLNRDLITMCNGCYGTLLEVNHTLKHDNKARSVVNEQLSEINKQYKGSNDVLHVVDVLYNKIGLEELKKMVVRKLNLKVAVHYGCHLIRASKIRPWCGESENPRFFEELVEITGCKTVEYKDRLMCCGAGGGVRSAIKEVSLDFTREKLENMREAGAEAIIVACPFCQLQFDLGQNEVNSIYKEMIGEPFSIPVVYITQLLGLAFGLDPTVLGLQRFKMDGLPPFQPLEFMFTKELNMDSEMMKILNFLDEKP